MPCSCLVSHLVAVFHMYRVLSTQICLTKCFLADHKKIVIPQDKAKGEEATEQGAQYSERETQNTECRKEQQQRRQKEQQAKANFRCGRQINNGERCKM